MYCIFTVDKATLINTINKNPYSSFFELHCGGFEICVCVRVYSIKLNSLTILNIPGVSSLYFCLPSPEPVAISYLLLVSNIAFSECQTFGIIQYI